MSVIQPGTMGDLSFVDKMINTYQNQKNDQPFVILLNDMGDERLKDKSIVQELKNKVGEDNVRIIHPERNRSAEIHQSWQLREEIAHYKPKAIIYGPMILEKDCAASKRVAAVSNVPFIVLPEYSYKYHGANCLTTGPGPEANGMFLDSFEENQTIDDEDAQKFSPTDLLENKKQIFFAYLNNHKSGHGVDPKIFQKELLSYLYFVTSTLVHSNNPKPAEIFTRITPEIFESYINELQQNNPYNCTFSIKYKDKIYKVSGKEGQSDQFVTMNLSNPFPLQKETIIAMLQACKRQQNPVCATGDQSLSETISIGVPFFYQTMLWKRDLARDLDRTAQTNKLDGVSEMNKKGFTFMSLSDADEFAKKYNLHREEWAIQYSELSNHISDLNEELPMKIESMIQNQSRLGYTHRNRPHLFRANPDEFSQTRTQFKEYKGDTLKANILADIKDKILGCINEATLNLVVEGFINSDEYKILKTGQAATTKLLNLETSSIKEFNKIVEEAREELKSKSSFMRADHS